MKRSWIIGLSAVALVAIPVTGVALSSSFLGNGSAIADESQKPNMRLRLVGEKQIVGKDAAGEPQVTWETISKTGTKPGDVLRYRLSGKNQGKASAKRLILTQPIPTGTTYVLQSAQGTDTQTQFSIDGAKSFSTAPKVTFRQADGTIGTRPAPATAYTHVQWKFDRTIAANAQVNVAYQVQVN